VTASLLHPPSKPKRRWYRPTLRRVLVAIAVLAVAAGLVRQYRYHLLWKFYLGRGQFADVPAIPTSAMPWVTTPENWIRCRFGSLEFDVPPGMEQNVTAADVHFTDRDGRLDSTWVRCVCQSVRFSGEVFPGHVGKEKVKALFKIVSNDSGKAEKTGGAGNASVLKRANGPAAGSSQHKN
jgi:hypothetical protein